MDITFPTSPFKKEYDTFKKRVSTIIFSINSIPEIFLQKRHYLPIISLFEIRWESFRRDIRKRLYYGRKRRELLN